MSKSSSKKVNKKRWFVLGAVGTALLLIPRRSSKQAVSTPTVGRSNNLHTKNSEKNTDQGRGST
ncbi:hypothetical protein H4W00_001021 [Psychrobacter sp. PL19]|uniref:hypothetical protein n=1 Tax=Psychrobacter sp. PL19 TaxID=2760711 RepID=UPI001AE691E7